MAFDASNVQFLACSSTVLSTLYPVRGREGMVPALHLQRRDLPHGVQLTIEDNTFEYLIIQQMQYI